MAGVYLLDSRDSFIWNLAQAFLELGMEAHVQLVDDVELDALRDASPDLVVIGPGPRGPDELPHLVEIARAVSQEFPVFGVCLGLQALILSHGGEVTRASQPIHGKRTPIFHDAHSVFRGLPNPMWVMRYHSLVASTVPDDFEVIGRDAEQQVMAIFRKKPPFCAAVQFHPESIGTSGGMEILQNVLQALGLGADTIDARDGGIPPPQQVGKNVQRYSSPRRTS